MQLEEQRLEEKRLYGVIRDKEAEIVQLDKRNEDSLYLVKVLQ